MHILAVNSPLLFFCIITPTHKIKSIENTYTISVNQKSLFPVQFSFTFTYYAKCYHFSMISMISTAVDVVLYLIIANIYKG